MSKEREKDFEMLDAHVQKLIEHFDTVQIFVTKQCQDKDGGTVAANRGAGNWYARDGQCREWVVKNEEEHRESVRKKESEDE